MSWPSSYNPFSNNHTPVMLGLNSSTGSGAVPIAVDPTTGAILTEGGAGTQYTDGGTPPTHPIGTAIEFNNSGTWATVSAANPLPVSATLSLSNYALETGGNLATTATNTTGLNNTVGTAGSAIPTKGLVVQGSDGTNARAISTDSSGRPNVNINGTVPVSGTFWQTTQPVSLASLPALASGSNTIGAVTQASGPWTSNITQIGGSSLSLGTQTAANSIPVALPTATITSLQQPTLQSGSTTAVTQATASNLNATVVNASNPGVNIGSVELTDGTNTTNVMAPGTANSTGNAMLVGATSYSYSYSYTAATTGTSYDVGNYRWVSVQITTQYTTSTTGFQVSNDNTNWYNTALEPSTAQATGTSVSTGTAGVVYHGPLSGRYFRINVTGTYSSGTAAGVVTFSTLPTQMNSIGANVVYSAAETTGTITSSSSTVTSSSTSGVGGYAIINIYGTYAGVSFTVATSDNGFTTSYNLSVYDAAANQWLAPGATITPGTNASKIYWVPCISVSNETKVTATAWSSGTANIHISTGSGQLPGSTMSQLMDAAGNNRGANVTAANELVVADSGLRPLGTSINTYENQFTTNATTTVTASTAYISSVTIAIPTGGTTSSITIQDGQGTPLKLINSLATTSALTGPPDIYTWSTPIKMTSGISVVTAGAAAATVNVWINYYQ